MNFQRRDLLGMLAVGATPPDGNRDLPGAGSDTGTLFADLGRLIPLDEFPLSFLSGRWPNLEDYRREGRRRVLAALAATPAPVTPNAEVVSREDLDGFTREKVIFSTRPEFRVPAYVHVPKRRGPLPAIVDLHSHGGMFVFGKEKVIDFGDNHPAMSEYHRVNYAGRPTATELARRGYVVITIDAFAFGERRILMDDDRAAGWDRSKYTLQDVQRLNAKCRAKEPTIVKTLAFAGMTWPGIIAWDDMRTVDYLVSRPEVDPARIGCVGVSMGGYRSLLLAGLDSRITAAVVTGFMSTVRPMMRRHMDTHSFVHFIPGIHSELDLPDIVALRAPKPLLVQQCRRDGLFPPAGMQESVEKLQRIFSKAEAAAAFSGQFYDVPHSFNIEMQDAAFAWLDRQLKPA